MAAVLSQAVPQSRRSSRVSQAAATSLPAASLAACSLETGAGACAPDWAGAAAGGGGWLALALLVLFVRQRQRLSSLRQRSRHRPAHLAKAQHRHIHFVGAGL